ncbi:MAG: hypothetical protein AAF957_21300 [Planctomycetota bacterium]
MEGASTSDPVARTLIPVLVHEVNNTTQLLVGLRALLDLPGGEELFSKRADELARASQQMDDLGFALAVLATANGANMLLARRNRRAVEILWSLAVRSLERSGEARVSCEGAPPSVAPSALDGWQAPWSAAALLLTASEHCGVETWRWRWGDDGALVGRSGGSGELAADAIDAIASRVPGATIESRAGEVEWRLPDAWLER